jgi:hypothetical protein
MLVGGFVPGALAMGECLKTRRTVRFERSEKTAERWGFERRSTLHQKDLLDFLFRENR